MKVLYDDQVFSWQEVGGISRYFVEIWSRLVHNYDVIIENSILATKNQYISKLNNIRQLLPNINFPYKIQIIKSINRLYSIYKLRKQNYNLFHPTYYDDYFLKYIGNKPYVVTVYDMIHEIYSDDFEDDLTAMNKNNVILKANRIIAISNSTKHDLVKLLNVDPSNVEVIHLASSLNLDNSKYVKLPKKYILYVGERTKYKNFQSSITEIKQIFRMDNSINLVCVGGRKFTSLEIESFGIYVNRCIQIDLTDPELIYAYQHAECLIITSLYEGFGLPILEAMQCSCPVICPHISSMPEVGGQAVLYYDPYNIFELSKSVINLTRKKNLRKLMIARGLKQASKFTWEKCAEKTIRCYKMALESSKNEIR